MNAPRRFKKIHPRKILQKNGVSFVILRWLDVNSSAWLISLNRVREITKRRKYPKCRSRWSASQSPFNMNWWVRWGAVMPAQSSRFQRRSLLCNSRTCAQDGSLNVGPISYWQSFWPPGNTDKRDGHNRRRCNCYPAAYWPSHEAEEQAKCFVLYCVTCAQGNACCPDTNNRSETVLK